MDLTFLNVTLVYPLLVGISGVNITIRNVIKIDTYKTGGSIYYIYNSLYILL